MTEFISNTSKVFVINDICRGLQAAKKNHCPLVFSPAVYGEAQSRFFEKRFEEIKKVYSQSSYQPNDRRSVGAQDIVFAWQAFEEQQAYKGYLCEGVQNRLFDDLDFTVPDSFSGFRKKAEKSLPHYYNDALEPFDRQVVERIDFYFHQSSLPSRYFETRNAMVGNDYSSQFSPYLACGALDVRYLYNQIKEYEERRGSNKSTYWLVFELLWREFFYWHYQVCETKFFSANGIKGAGDFSEYHEYSSEDLKRMSSHRFWQAAINELETTGFQSNRTRQLFASFWLHDLNLHWRSGARFFEKHLIDYDVFSNWGNWMYLAGVGVDPRGVRRFNIPEQLKRYDKNGEYLKLWN